MFWYIISILLCNFYFMSPSRIRSNIKYFLCTLLTSWHFCDSLKEKKKKEQKPTMIRKTFVQLGVALQFTSSFMYNIICPMTEDKLSSVEPSLRLETPSENRSLGQ